MFNSNYDFSVIKACWLASIKRVCYSYSISNFVCKFRPKHAACTRGLSKRGIFDFDENRRSNSSVCVCETCFDRVCLCKRQIGVSNVAPKMLELKFDHEFESAAAEDFDSAVYSSPTPSLSSMLKYLCRSIIFRAKI